MAELIWLSMIYLLYVVSAILTSLAFLNFGRDKGECGAGMHVRICRPAADYVGFRYATKKVSLCKYSTLGTP